jgi:hypothetical protein
MRLCLFSTASPPQRAIRARLNIGSLNIAVGPCMGIEPMRLASSMAIKRQAFIAYVAQIQRRPSAYRLSICEMSVSVCTNTGAALSDGHLHHRRRSGAGL